MGGEGPRGGLVNLLGGSVGLGKHGISHEASPELRNCAQGSNSQYEGYI